MTSIAFFITPHGFGHAARTCAIIQELLKRLPSVTPLILSTVPKEFFQNSIERDFLYYPFQTDVGFVQASALEVDMDKSITTLENFYGNYEENAKDIKDLLLKTDTKLVVSDISPIGIQIANELNLTSILIENFTWDWIYEFYEDRVPKLRPIINKIKEINQTAQYRIRTIPYCGEYDCDLIVPPVSRCVRKGRDRVREELNIGAGEKMILVSMGGVFERLSFINESFVEELRNYPVKLVCCTDGVGLRDCGNVIFLPKFSQFYHPDLVNASDGVIGKLGYSTLAEVANTGVPFAFVVREDYPEMDCLKTFALTLGNALEVNLLEFREGDMIQKVLGLLGLRRSNADAKNGAGECADFIVKVLNRP